MGFFDFFNSSKDKSQQDSKLVGESVMSDLERELTQAVAIEIYKMHITKQPNLRFFYEDGGILNMFVNSRLNDVEYTTIRQMDKNIYLLLISCHAMGCGGYTALCQKKFNKKVNEFTKKEIDKMFGSFNMTDTYELFLKEMGISPESNNKKCLDHICAVAVDTASKMLGKDIFETKNLKTLMKVMYNAGITVVMR